MRVLFLVSAGAFAMRRSVRAAVLAKSPEHEVRMLAPDAEAKDLRDLGVPTESWRPAGLFNVLRSINALRKTVERFDPDVIHAFGWTAAAVALGALPARYTHRMLVALQDPIRDTEMPKAFVDKRLPELLARAGSIACAYETLRRGIVDTFAVPSERVQVVPYGVAPLLPPDLARAPGRRGPIVGYASRLEADRGWKTIVDATVALARTYPDAQLWLGSSAPVASLVRAHARAARALDLITFFDDLPDARLFAGIDMLAVPKTRDGVPYPLVEALVSGIPIVGANVPGIADVLTPYAGWLVPDETSGFIDGLTAAWESIDDAWATAQAQRSATTAVFAPEAATAWMRATYARLAAAVPEAANAER